MVRGQESTEQARAFLEFAVPRGEQEDEIKSRLAVGELRLTKFVWEKF